MLTLQKPLVIALALCAGLTSSWSSAQDLQLNSTTIVGQTQFRALSDDLGAALSYKGKTPAESLGITGFDVGISVTSTKLANADRYGAALDNNNLLLPTVSAQKGLPFGFDVGATYASANGIKFVGGELRYALVEGGTLVPAVGLRGSMTRLTGVDELGLSTRGVDLSVSKGFAFATPYAGIGRVWVNSAPKFASNTPLETETFALNKYYVGVGLNMMLLNLNIEADRTGDATSYSAKLGIRF